MAKNMSKVKEVDVAAVAGNTTLSAGVERCAIERCKNAIEKFGILHTPVVGQIQGGKSLLLSGQCELAALRELGVKKMDAIEVELTSDAGAKEKLSLLLMSLQSRPGALCEGLLLQEAVNAGVPRTEIQAMLGKSASWISNRIALVTRLDSNVYAMVKNGLLDPRSAQEIARLPADIQFKFASTAVHECLPKSTIESLVAGYNDESCPDAVRTQILDDPKTAMRRMVDRRRSVKAGQVTRHNDSEMQYAMSECIRLLKLQMANLCQILHRGSAMQTAGSGYALKDLKEELLALLAIVSKFVSPGKKEVGHHV